ncbi:MAG: cupin domain-containing protein [Chloroflexota bacterium]
MLVIDLDSCEEFVAGDNTILREVLSPTKQDVAVRYSLAHAIVRRGDVSLPHRLRTTEVYYILEGQGIMYIGDEQAEVGPDQAIYIPPLSVQSIRNTGTTDLKFICIVDPAWRVEDEEVC